VNPMNIFTAVVEDIHDPEEMNRVKVRILGFHSDQTVINDANGKGIPPDDLPWAWVMMPNTSASMHGIGTNHGLVEGSWVVGFSRDQDTMNDLVILGSIMGIPTKKNPNPSSPPKAFYGQDGKYPDEEFLKEPDVSRLARGVLNYKDEKWKPVPKIKDEEKERGILEAGGGIWNQKDHKFGAKYPHNKVYETTSRHTVEFDDTPGKERITIWHGPSHTFIDILPDGSVQQKIEGDDYSIVIKDKKMLVKGDLSISVEGSAKFLCHDDIKIEALKNIDIEAVQTIQIVAAGKIDIASIAAVTIKSLGIITLDGSAIKISGTRI
jgi:hypothetical protein